MTGRTMAAGPGLVVGVVCCDVSEASEAGPPQSSTASRPVMTRRRGRRVSLAPCERDNLIREVQWSHCLALEMSHKSHVSPVDQFEWRAECEKLLVRKFVYFTPILKPSQRERGGSGMQHDSMTLYCSVYCVQYREYEYSWQVINSQLSSYQGWSGYKSFPSGGTT